MSSKLPNVAIIRLDKDSVPNFPTFIPSWGNPDLPIKSIQNLYYLLLLSDHYVIIYFFYFNTASSGVCQTLRVQLQNNAFEAHDLLEGTYLLASEVNGQPSWIKNDPQECCGIWHVPDSRVWLIGPLQYSGSNQGGIESKNLGSKLEYPENIVDWNYHTDNQGWIKGNDDVIIGRCIEENKKKGKSVPFICYELANFNKC